MIKLKARGLNNHIHTVHELKLYGNDWNQEQYPCELCNKSCRSKYDLFQHVVNKHTEIKNNELESQKSSTKSITEEHITADGSSYNYVPCTICGQAVDKQAWGMMLHLETLKPVIGLDMSCPQCSGKFIEHRALFQHYKFCRLKSQLNLNEIHQNKMGETDVISVVLR